MKTTSDYIAGVIGAGSFGTAIANIMAENGKVLLLARRQEIADQIHTTRTLKGRKMHENIHVTTSHEELASSCGLIFPIVPAAAFRNMLQQLSPYLHPYHILIHGTKGLDVRLPEGKVIHEVETLEKEEVKTMSELIVEETVVRRVGCMAGPNLSFEIFDGQPAATVVASHFDEVIREGSAVLRSRRFRVHANHHLIGIELAGVLKNIMAISAGILEGLGYGHNTRSLLIARGMAEIIHLGKGLGADPKAFLGLAGIGDLVATCSSSHSRNFTVGHRLAKGETLAQIIESMDEVAEGVNTTCIMRALANRYKLPAPITQAVYRVLFEGMDIQRGLRLLMEYPFTEDVEFI